MDWHSASSSMSANQCRHLRNSRCRPSHTMWDCQHRKRCEACLATHPNGCAGRQSCIHLAASEDRRQKHLDTTTAFFCNVPQVLLMRSRGADCPTTIQQWRQNSRFRHRKTRLLFPNSYFVLLFFQFESHYSDMIILASVNVSISVMCTESRPSSLPQQNTMPPLKYMLPLLSMASLLVATA